MFRRGNDENKEAGQEKSKFVFVPQNSKAFILVNLLTALGALPYGLGLVAAILLKSSGVLILACLVGGACFGPALSGVVDCILRSLRSSQDDWWYSYRKAWRQNWRESILPGIVLCLFVGFLLFMGLQFVWTEEVIPLVMLICGIVSALLAAMVFTVYWAQLVLFSQSGLWKLRNCPIFILPNIIRCLGAAVMQVAWWVLLAMLLPGSLLIVALFGFWLILYWTYRLLYPALNRVFEIEKRIAAEYPDQTAE